MDLQTILILSAAAVGAWILNRRPTFAGAPGTGTATIPPGAPPSVTQWRDEAVAAGQAHGLSPQLILAVIWKESSGIASAKGSAGEIGLMQIKEVAAEDAGFNSAPWDPGANIFVGAAFLALQIRRMGGDVYEGLRAYNQGETGARRDPSKGAAYARDVLRKAGWT